MQYPAVSRLFRPVFPAIFLLMAIVVPSHAKKIAKYIKVFDITLTKNNAGDPNATSVTIDLTNITKFDVVSFKCDQFPTVTPPTSGGTYTLTAKNGTSLGNGEKLTVRIQANKPIEVQSAIFLAGGTTLAQGEVGASDFKGDPMYEVFNDLMPAPSIDLTGLMFYENHAPLNPDTIDPSVPLDGTGIAEPDADLGASATPDDYTVPPIADGTFFYAQGNVFDTASGKVVGDFVDGFSTDVPEPSSLALAAAGCALLAGAWRGRHRRNIS